MISRQLQDDNAFLLHKRSRCCIKLSLCQMVQSPWCRIFTGTLSTVLFLLLWSHILSAGTQVAPGSTIAQVSENPTTVVDLQPFLSSQSIVTNPASGTTGKLTLINLNPKVNQWYILRVSSNTTSNEYHLENPYPKHQSLALDEKSPDKLILTQDGKTIHCPPWGLVENDGNSAFETARDSSQVFAPLCDGRLYLRNPAKGHRTAIETVTDFLRDNLPGGEAVVGFVKDTFFQDKYLENTRTTTASKPQSAHSSPDFPSPAVLNPASANKMIAPAELGIEVKKTAAGMLTGQWYPVKNNPGVFVSLIQPKAVAAEILNSYPRLVNQLDSVEAGALAYLVAFDLSQFELGYAVGTEHPRLQWSERVVDQVKIPNLPGPDGIDTISPLVANGMVNPVEASRTVATFTGGFKRSHGAFKYGDLAYQNRGSHYGFIENGVILSTLQPGLATLLVQQGGLVEMKTWTKEDNQEEGEIVQARQNGVPLVEWDSKLRKPIPGQLVVRWAQGNWSGSEDKKLRSLRAGVALQQTEGKMFLIYGYFSTATPSAMVRVFQAYNCRYAMHLDMNALEHTYLALYHKEGKHLLVQHLIQGMSVLDKSNKGTYIPRFIGYPDNRDFFYLMNREH